MSKRSSYVDTVKKNLLSLGEVKRSETPVFKPQAVEVVNATSPTNYIDTKTEETPLEKNDLTLLGRASTGTGETTPPVAPSPRASRSGSRSNLNTLRSTSRTKSNLPSTNELVRRDNERYGNTFPKGSFGSGSKPGPAVDTRPRHSVGTSKDQPKVSKFEKPKGVIGKLKEKVKEISTKQSKKTYEQRKQKEGEKFKDRGKREAVNASTFKQKNVRGGGIPGKSGKDEKSRPPKERQTVAKLPSNYKKTEAEAFKKAKSWKDSKAKGKAAEKKTGIKTRPKAGSFGISEAGRKQAEANRAEAAAKKKAEAAAAKKRAEAKKKAEAAKKKKAEASKPTGFGGLTSRRSSSRRSRSKPTSRGARGRSSSSSRSRGGSSSGGSRSNSGSKSASRGARGSSSSRSRGGVSRGSSRRTNRSRSRRRCDIRCKFDISLLTNNNLEIDDLAVVAYFIRDLKKINE